MWKVNTDGGCRDNPGPGSWAFVINKGNGDIEEFAGFLPHCTNNQSEYRALEAACILIAQKPRGELPDRIQFFSDSQLVVNQINGVFKVNDSVYSFYKSASEVFSALRTILPISISWVRRDVNTEADALCNRVMDKHGIVCSKKGKTSKPRHQEVFV